MKRLLIGLCAVAAIGTAVTVFSHLTTFPGDYQTWKASEKLKYVWSKRIVPTRYKKLPDIPNTLSPFHPLNLAAVLSVDFLTISFDQTRDDLPIGRKKLLHPSGSVAVVEFKSDPSSPFSGIFGKGGFGLARLSLAGNPSTPPFGIGSFTPGMAIKFLIDKKPSVNLHVMNDLAGQGDNTNFFGKSFSNIIAPATGATALLSASFSKVRNPPTHLPVDHVAAIETNGRVVPDDELSVPYQLVFIPAAYSVTSKSKVDFRTNLEVLIPGDVLYNVLASTGPDEDLEVIGALYLRSSFVASEFGDEGLFFQHRR